jgi:plasmid stabilization system protein ParE
VTRLEFHPEALAEYEFAVQHYEYRQAGLGSRFIASVEAALQSVLDAPATWPVLEQDVRRRLTRVFPYAVLFSIEPDSILVLAVMHCHQQPGYWRSRTDG